jgi:hypothetical protein
MSDTASKVGVGVAFHVCGCVHIFVWVVTHQKILTSPSPRLVNLRRHAHASISNHNRRRRMKSEKGPGNALLTTSGGPVAGTGKWHTLVG